MIRYLSLLWSILIVVARPTEITSSQEPNTRDCSDETRDDCAPTEDENNDNDNASSDKEKPKPNTYIETATSHCRYSPVLPSFEQNYEERNCKEYGSPGPPNRHAHPTYASGLQEQSFSKLSLDRYPSEVSTVELGGGRAVLRGETMASAEQGVTTWESLSADDLTFDARACALPRRRPKDAITKSEKFKKFEDTKHDAKMDRKQTILKGNDQGSMEDFIKTLVAMQYPSKASVHFFDAVIVYEKEDYWDALNFKEETMMIVKSELNEEVRIELYDSQVFDQSKICVVQDVIDKCSVIFVYLTNNFKSPELKFFIEEAIGICRLGLNNRDIQAGVFRNDKQWVIKPVHTAHPRMRAYKVPTGLLTVNGIEWYNKESSHTQQQVRAVIHTAMNTRKQREIQAGISHPQSHMQGQVPTRQMTKTHHAPNTKTDPISCGRNAENWKHEHLTSHQSHDAMSLVEESGQFYNSRSGSLPNENNTVPADGNIHNRFQYIPSPQANPPNVCNYSNPNGFDAQSHSLNHHFDPRYAEGNFNRNFPPNAMYNEPVQSTRNHQLLYQSGQYMSPTNNQQSFPQFQGQGQIFQSAGMQDRNVQQVNFSGNPNQIHVNRFQGNVPSYNSNHPSMPPELQPGISNLYRNGQGYTGQQNMAGRSAAAHSRHSNYMEHPQTSGGMPMNGYGIYQQVPFNQQNANVPQHFSQYEDQPLTRDALRSESGTLLFDQRNDTPHSTQLSVVSKVTGKLIVNPNLSTDDVEIDNYVSSQSRHNKSHSIKDRRKGKHATKYHESTSESDSSSDSDIDIPKTKGRWKRKVVNVVGCKIVQMGSRNKVKEKSTKKSDDVDTTRIDKSKTNEIELKHSSENVASSHAMVSIPKYCLENHGPDLASAAESNILSTDNMSASSSIQRNLDTGIRRKPVAEKIDILGTMSGGSDGQFYEQHTLNRLGSVQSWQEPGLKTTDTSDDRHTNFRIKTFTSLQTQGAAKERECPHSPDDNISDNDDYLFESGTNSSDFPKVAPFTFSHTKSCGINVLKGSIDYFKVTAQYTSIIRANKESEID